LFQEVINTNSRTKNKMSIRRIENYLINNVGPVELFIAIFFAVCFFHGINWINGTFDIVNIFMVFVLPLFVQTLWIFGYIILIIALFWGMLLALE